MLYKIWSDWTPGYSVTAVKVVKRNQQGSGGGGSSKKRNKSKYIQPNNLVFNQFMAYIVSY